MKVIIIKDCKDGKINEIIDVSPGYATNFLIKKQFAVPLNIKTQKKLQDNIQAQKEKVKIKLSSTLKIKDFIESLVLTFSLNMNSNLMVHGSITRKNIIKKLKKEGINLDSHAIENIKINSIGISLVKIFLQNNVIAKLKIEVKNNGEK